MELAVGSEPMTLGSPTSPKPASGAQFLPGFLMGDLPAPSSPQPRPFGFGTPLLDQSQVMASSVAVGPGSTVPQPVVPTHKDKSGAPPVRSIYAELAGAGTGTPAAPHRQMQSPMSARLASTPGAGVQQLCMSPAQVDPFYSQGETLTSEDQLDQTWVTVFGFPPASASYILLQFAQYGNILRHSMATPGNWMHLQYQSKLQARKALSKDGKVFGDAIMVGVKPCIDKSVMDSVDVSSPLSSSFFSSSALPSTPRSAIRPLSAAQRASASDYQVVADRQTPRKDDSFVSKAMEYLFGW
ncbi:nucleoporin NUP35-like [Periophthalmus magnuspinnatus]|uniref:nucleoporin NUP35-like n=1 Tax=Periophthalmus magnuspinnatus TaxID=409849 RepID=UPI00145AC240|nr:nucleoporin NUP35-like [Periophthalmus magnuspinnatus]